jgi:hypothetical protein
MATVISILHPKPTPLAGESGLVLSLTFKQPTEGSDEQGYRMVARAEETGRVIGRWVSDCSLTATETALLWVSKSLDDQGEPLWSLAVGADSLDWQRVLDTVTEYQPGEHPQIPPRRVVSILAGNFPAVIVQPGRRALAGPVVRQLGQAAPLRTSVKREPEPPPAPQRVQRALPEPSRAPTRTREPEPVKASEMGEEEQELSAMVREMYRALKAGASAEEVRAAMLQIAEPDEEEDDLNTWDDGEEEDEEDEEDEEGEEGEEDEEDEGGGEDEVQEDAEDTLSWERGMRVYAADQRAYDKLARTQQRAAEVQDRVQAHLAAQAAQAAAKAARAKVPIQVTDEAQEEPKAPKRRNLRRLAEAITEVQREPVVEPAEAAAPEAIAEASEKGKRRTKKIA